MVEDIIEIVKGKERIKNTKILIDGKEIKLKFTMPIWYRMEEEICILDDLYTMMHSKERFQEGNIPALVALMSGDVITAQEVKKGCDPATMRALIEEIQRVVAKAMTMREKKYDDDSVHDEVLEEIEKKEPKAD